MLLLTKATLLSQTPHSFPCWDSNPCPYYYKDFGSSWPLLASGDVLLQLLNPLLVFLNFSQFLLYLGLWKRFEYDTHQQIPGQYPSVSTMGFWHLWMRTIIISYIKRIRGESRIFNPVFLNLVPLIVLDYGALHYQPGSSMCLGLQLLSQIMSMLLPDGDRNCSPTHLGSTRLEKARWLHPYTFGQLQLKWVISKVLLYPFMLARNKWNKRMKQTRTTMERMS